MSAGAAIRSVVRRFAGGVLDMVYPSSCHLCKRVLPGAATLCGGCAGEIPPLEPPFCGTCGEPFEGRIDGDFDCPNCRGTTFPFEFARPGSPHHPQLLEMIHELKYGRRVELAHSLGALTLRAFGDVRLAPALEEGWPLVPVPLHRSREGWRHFNQAAEIARELSRLTGLPRLSALRRIRRTDMQTRLGRSERKKNLRGAFALSPEGVRFAATSPAGAVLVDDVLTTGSTVAECAAVLRKAGVQKVVVVTVMRG